ncbi:MAG: response regulator transcription factor, partial [Spirochaetia bacterium]
RLLEEAASRGIHPEYVGRILSAFSRPNPRRQPLLESLSERELEVLEIIAQGLSNQEIAERLYLSLYTVKAHIRNIFGKLDVTSRTQAVARARELGLLKSP